MAAGGRRRAKGRKQKEKEKKAEQDFIHNAAFDKDAASQPAEKGSLNWTWTGKARQDRKHQVR